MTTQSNENRKTGSHKEDIKNEQKPLVARNIDERMKILGIKSNSQLSELSKVSRGVITSINISKEVRAMVAIKLAKSLDCNVEL